METLTASPMAAEAGSVGVIWTDAPEMPAFASTDWTTASTVDTEAESSEASRAPTRAA